MLFLLWKRGLITLTMKECLASQIQETAVILAEVYKL